ncbi:MAG: putative DNA binding domain-containing protein [Betaproteobacteria bacterium]|nr:putative DNA binding domain-containing protein [Betaproteobacteria bacterium]
MLRTELMDLIAAGENSGVEFKRDDVRPEQLAKECVAFANFRGGRVLLGVEDDGAVSGITRPDLERWVMDTVFGRYIHPVIIPYYEELVLDDGKRVAVITVEQGIAKPYVLRANDREDIYVRVGTTSRLATREQQARLFQESRMVHTEVLPVSGADLNVLDSRRVTDYVERLLGDNPPADRFALEARLSALGFMAGTERGVMASLGGVVLFGKAPRRLVRQAGLRIMVFEGKDRSYEAKLDDIVDAPLVGLWEDGEQVEPGVIEAALERLLPFISVERGPADQALTRQRIWNYPPDVLREALLNAFAHRDWTRAGDVEACAYVDRVEITSPGALPNTMTVEKMRAGQRSPRNPVLVDVLRDYGYVDARGMGIRRKIIPEMLAAGAREPGIDASEDYVRITLYKPGFESAA